MREFRDRVLDLGRCHFPEARFAHGTTDDELEFNATHVHLGNLFAATKMMETAEDVDAEIVRFLTILVQDVPTPDEPAAVDWADAKPLLRPKLVAKEALEALPQVLCRDFSANMAVAYGLDYGTYDLFVHRDRLEIWGATQDMVEAAALANLEAMSASLAVSPIAAEGLMLFGCNDAYDASRILLPGLRHRLVSVLGPKLFAGIPGRDAFAIWLKGSPNHSGFVSWIREAAHTEPHRLTDEIFIITKDGVRLASADEIALSDG